MAAEKDFFELVFVLIGRVRDYKSIDATTGRTNAARFAANRFYTHKRPCQLDSKLVFANAVIARKEQ